MLERTLCIRTALRAVHGSYSTQIESMRHVQSDCAQSMHSLCSHRVLSKEAAEGFDERRRDRLASIGAVQLCNEGRLSQQVVHEAQVVQQSTI